MNRKYDSFFFTFSSVQLSQDNNFQQTIKRNKIECNQRETNVEIYNNMYNEKRTRKENMVRLKWYFK